jgi:hypothetical protein
VTAVRDLLRAVRPLTIPILGILLVGSFTLRWWWPLLACLCVVALVGWGLVGTEGKAGLKSVREALTGAVFLVSAFVLVGGMLFAVLVQPGDDHRTTSATIYEAFSRILIWAGFLLWGAAIALRLAGYATSRLRLLLVIVLGAAFVRYFFGLFVIGRSSGVGLADHLAWAAVIAVLVAYAVRETYESRPDDPPWAPEWRRHGLAAALLAGVAFVTASIAGMNADPPTGRANLRFTESPAPVHADVSALMKDDEMLAREFSPILEFAPGQRWPPTNVEDYLKNADLQRRDDSLEHRKPLSLEDLPGTCDDGKRRACYQLTIQCSLAASDKTDCEHDDDLADGFATAGTAYVRHVDAADLAADQEARGFGVPAFAGEVNRLLQYWFFYYYDDWRARTLFGWLRQSHEADWEVVTVGFSSTEPLFVALSAHCGGTWFRWQDMHVADLRGHPLHPIVGVAQGSQANYDNPTAQRPPDNWARCAKIPSRSLSVAGFAYNIREHMGASSALQLEHLLPAVETDSPMSFKGLWGMNAESNFETEFGRRYPLSEDDRGPPSPPLQPLWIDPMATVFCSQNKTFRRAGGGKAPRRCPKASAPAAKAAQPAP